MLSPVTCADDARQDSPAPRPGELEALLWTLITRVTRTLIRAGVLVAEAEQSQTLWHGRTISERCGIRLPLW